MVSLNKHKYRSEHEITKHKHNQKLWRNGKPAIVPVSYHRMDAAESRDKMKKELVLNGSDFSKPWKSSDVTFLVEEQRFYVHRWVLAMWSPVFEKMFTSNFSERAKTEIPLPCKRSDEFEEMLLMVYSHAERPITIENCFFLLKLADEYQMELVIHKCEDFLVSASESICTGHLNRLRIFPFLTTEQFKNEKEQVLALLILAQEYKLKRLTAACIHEARDFNLKELKQDFRELCDLIEPENYCRILERIIERMEDRFWVS